MRSVCDSQSSLQMLLRCLNGESAPDYLAVLVSMELSLHSLEVVSRLTTSLDLPQEFINEYIANCIASCDRAEVSPPCLPEPALTSVCVHTESVIRTTLHLKWEEPVEEGLTPVNIFSASASIDKNRPRDWRTVSCPKWRSKASKHEPAKPC